MKKSWAFCFDRSYEWRWQVIEAPPAQWRQSAAGHQDIEDCIRDAATHGFAGSPALFIDAGGKVMDSTH